MPDTDAPKASAKPTPKPNLPEGHVMVRILKRGDGRIFTGETDDGKIGSEKFLTHKYGDVVPMPREFAEVYDADDKGWVEIQP